MYNGIGLQTARGSGTNGYVQTNKFFVRPKTSKVLVDNSKGFAPDQGTAGITRKPNKEILEHDRKRQIELKLTILEDKLTDQGYTDAEIAEKLEETRRTLEAADAAATAASDGGAVPVGVSDKNVSDTQTHQIAARKEKKMEQLRAALGLDEPDAKKQAKLLDETEGERQKKNGVDDGGSEYEEGEILHGHEDIGLPAMDDQIQYGNPEKESVKGTKVDNYGGLSRKEKGKKKRHNHYSSDSDSESKDATDSDVDIKRKQISLKRSRKSKHEDSDGISSSSDDSDEGRRKQVHKTPGSRQKEQARNRKGKESKKRRGESSDTESEHTSESESDSFVEAKHKRKSLERSKKGKYDSRDGSESDSGDDFDKVYHRRGAGNYPEGRRRHDSDSDSDHKSHLSHKKDKYAEARGGHDSDKGYQRRGADRYPVGHTRRDSDSDSDHKGHLSHKKDKYTGHGRHGSDKGNQKKGADRSPVARRRHDSDSGPDLDGHVSRKNDKYAEVHKSHAYDNDSDENGPLRHRKDVKQLERKRRNDSGEDDAYHNITRWRNQKSESNLKKFDYKNDGKDEKSSGRLDVDDGFRADQGNKSRDKPQERNQWHGRYDRDDDRNGSDSGEKVDRDRRSRRHDSDLDGYDKKHSGRDLNDVKPEDKHYKSKDDGYVDHKDGSKNHSMDEEPKNGKSIMEREDFVGRWHSNDDRKRKHDIDEEEERPKDMDGTSRKRNRESYDGKARDMRDEVQARRRHNNISVDEEPKNGKSIEERDDFVERWHNNDDHKRKHDIDEEERPKDMDGISRNRNSESYEGKARDTRDEVQTWRRHDRAEEDREYRKHVKDGGEMDVSRKRSGREEVYGIRRHERDADSHKRFRHDESRPSERRRNEGGGHNDDRRRR